MAILKTKYKNPIGASINPIIEDILISPHTLIAGTTGSGKSVLLNNILISFLNTRGCNNSFVLIDPKRVELSLYKNFPHCVGYTSDITQAVNYLDCAIDLIEKRYKYMEKKHLRQFDGSHYYIIIDELADIMISPQKKAFQLKLQKILQIARAANIHVIACTQAPSRQVIPAAIVLNFTNRVALRCLNNIESRQILNQAGAEKLPQYGKAYYLSPKNGISKINIEYLDNTYYQYTVNLWQQLKINPIKQLLHMV